MFFIGMVLAMQSAVTLKSFGYVSAVGGLVAASCAARDRADVDRDCARGQVWRGRSPPNWGTMRVSEEIDALETMGLNPVQFLIVPASAGDGDHGAVPDESSGIS
jgi:phospholipid/cholesterol/gamma-HCH transport system permease protein